MAGDFEPESGDFSCFGADACHAVHLAGNHAANGKFQTAFLLEAVQLNELFEYFLMFFLGGYRIRYRVRKVVSCRL